MSQESKKQTAVEWLALYIKGITNLNCNEVIDQAKAMEKEQQKDAWVDGNNTEICRRSIEVDECFNYYYTEVYGKE
jgi:hypothetical protein